MGTGTTTTSIITTHSLDRVVFGGPIYAYGPDCFVRRIVRTNRFGDRAVTDPMRFIQSWFRQRHLHRVKQERRLFIHGADPCSVRLEPKTEPFVFGRRPPVSR
jgi:hypothetical protein